MAVDASPLVSGLLACPMATPATMANTSTTTATARF